MKQLCLKYFRICWGRENNYLLSLIFIVIAITKILIIATPIIFGKLIDGLSTQDKSSLLLDSPLLLALIYGLSWLFAKIAQVIQELLFSTLYQKLFRKIMHHSLTYIHQLPYDFFVKNNSGNISHKIRLGVRGFDVIFSSMIFTFIPTIIEFVLIFGMFAYYAYNPLYFFSLALSIFIYYYVTLVLTKRRLTGVRKLNDTEIELFTSFCDNMTNFEANKLYNKQTYLSGEYDSLLFRFQKTAMKVTKQMCSLKTVQDLILGVILIVFFVTTVRQHQDGLISLGELVMFISYLMLLFAPIEVLAIEQDSIQQSLVDMEELLLLLNQQCEDTTFLPNITLDDSSVSFNSVTFSYTSSKAIIEDLSFSIGANTTNAIIGSSGSGKSTIAKLLLKFYGVQSGNILIDYKDISNHSISSIRDNIAYMSQDIVLFNHTIKSNIAYSRDGLVEDAEIYEAAKLAQIHDVILEMPDGYDTIIGERGAMLSLGERQRIALARVLLKKPKILIFDEITASLDLYNKERVEDTIKSLRNKYTIIIISHNLSFMSELDQIILIDKGKVVTAGTHNNLAKSKLYKSLYRGGEPC